MVLEPTAMIGATVIAALVGSIFFFNDNHDGNDEEYPDPPPGPSPHEGTDAHDEITGNDPDADENGSPA